MELNQHPLSPDQVQKWLYKNIDTARNKGDIETLYRMAVIANDYLKAYKLLDVNERANFAREVNGAINFKRQTIKQHG